MKWHWNQPRFIDSSTSQDPDEEIMETDYLSVIHLELCGLELELACLVRTTEI